MSAPVSTSTTRTSTTGTNTPLPTLSQEPTPAPDASAPGSDSAPAPGPVSPTPTADPAGPAPTDTRAYWLTPSLLAWPATLLPPGVALTDCVSADGARHASPAVGFGLVCAPTGGTHLAHGVLHRGARATEVPLGITGTLDAQRPDLVASYPQLTGYFALTTADEFGAPRLSTEDVADLLTGQLTVIQRANGAGEWVTACTGVQTWPVIDALWGSRASARDGSAPLGAVFDDAAARPAPPVTASTATQPASPAAADAGSHRSPRLSFALWAPTATDVALLTWNTGDPTGSVPLVPGEPTRTPATRQGDGRWEVSDDVVLTAGIQPGCQYLWEVTVYAPSTGRVERNLVTDPYSRALTLDSRRSVAVDLSRPDLCPQPWQTPAPQVTNDAARVIYELHVRDFSAADATVPPALRGTYAAFGARSAGTTHLRELVEAGVDTLHLLPVFDLATVPEDPAARREPQVPDDAGPASPRQQAAVAQTRDTDAYNWGYDPRHWMAPEGSYAPAGQGDGGARVAAVREMIGHLHALGLQVVLDQVYNHTSACGQEPHSVLDRIVPGYYHRLDTFGRTETSACGANVATERAMAERLMIDACVAWVRDYRVDGFRFDLMGYHSVETMRRLRQAVDAAAAHVVGHRAYLYGEGWDMGEVAGNRLFTQAVQGQVGASSAGRGADGCGEAGLGAPAPGLHIGTFNDRVRDALVGNQFGADPRVGQGLGSGAASDPTGWGGASAQERAADLAWRTSLVRLSLAGNLRDLEVPGPDGTWVRGDALRYGAGPAAYADEPVDCLAYVSSHDNETLFDRLAYKLPPGTPMRERVRMSTLCLAAVTLGQGPAFWSAGVEMLRSKSLDADSFDSGDWFNAIDWTGQDNGWGRGLPPAWRNFDRWVIQAALLADPLLRPTSQDIADAYGMALDLLRLRRSTPLLSLGSAALVRERVSFPALRPVGVPGQAGPEQAGPGTVPAAEGAAGPGMAGPEDDPLAGVVVMVVDDGAGAADLDPAADGAMVAVNPRGHAVSVAIDDLVGRAFRLSPIQAEGYDMLVRRTAFDASAGVLTVPARTAAVLVER